MIVSNKGLEVKKLGECFSTVEAIAIENRPRSLRGASPLLWALEENLADCYESNSVYIGWYKTFSAPSFFLKFL